MVDYRDYQWRLNKDIHLIMGAIQGVGAVGLVGHLVPVS